MPPPMCAEISNSDSLKKAVRKYEKKLRQISCLEEQGGSRELTKEETEKVSKYASKNARKNVGRIISVGF